MSTKNPYTKIEVVEERHPNQPENTPLVKPQHILINGQIVRVAKDGIRIDHGDVDRVAVVEVALLVDEFSIRQVPNGYTDGKTSNSTGVPLHFDAGEYITKPGAPVTTKIVQPRDHLGRFTKRKTHYSDYLTDD